MDDNNTTIDIRGKLELKNNSTFSFNYHNNSNTTYGYIKLANTSILPSRNITAGSNCDINFTGNSQNKKILQINQETFYAPPSIVNFTISSGKVELAANARIQADGLNTIIDFHSAKFTSTTGGNNGHRGVHLYGQPNVTINNCIFENGNSGIFAFLTYGGAPLTIFNSSFSNNLIGVDANDKGCSLRGCNFNNNATGYKGSNMIFNSSCLESYFNYNTSVGAFWQSSNSAVFTSDNSHFDNNEVGLWANNGPLHVQCGSINYNNFGLKIENGSTLIMDAASAVTAVGNNYTIKPLAATYLNINNGYNDLTPALVNNQRAINGTMLPGGAYPLQAAFNKWNNSNSFADTDYLLSDINGNPLTINGSNPQSVVATCGYVLPEPCKRAPCPPEVGIEALVLCPDCDVINTAGFVNKKLNEATSTTLELLNSKKFNKYRTAIKLFYQILNSNYLNPDDKESYLLQLNYQKLKETLGNAFLANQISKTENQVKLCAEVQNVIDIEDKLIGKAIQDKDFKRKFLFNMDKVQSLRVASRRDLSKAASSP